MSTSAQYSRLSLRISLLISLLTSGAWLLISGAGLGACRKPAPRPLSVPQHVASCASASCTSASCASASCTSREALPLSLEPLPDPVYVAPIWTPSGEWAQISFHLNIHNQGLNDLKLDAIELRGFSHGRPTQLLRYEGAALAATLRALPWILISDSQTLAAANRFEPAFRAAKGDVTVAAGDGVSLLQQLMVGRDQALPDTIECVAQVGKQQVRRRLPVIRYHQATPLRLPFDGRWMVVAGHAFGEPHSKLYLRSEAFAYDFSIVGVNLETYSGDPRNVKSYRAYRRPVLAAASGRVVAVHDGVLDDGRTGERPSWRTVVQDPSALGGNFIVIQHVGREHSAYLHLRAGLAVKSGDTVEAGQLLGYCGNSGNSSEPHLHFQLQDGPDPLTAAGLPARFGGLTLSYGRLSLYVSPEQPIALPPRMLMERGKREGSVALESGLGL